MVDVLGRTLEEARAMLAAEGLQVEVTETRTSRAVTLAGSLRVIRQGSPDRGTVRLVVTHERYRPAPPEARAREARNETARSLSVDGGDEPDGAGAAGG
jgi:hypothetical protein